MAFKSEILAAFIGLDDWQAMSEPIILNAPADLSERSERFPTRYGVA